MPSLLRGLFLTGLLASGPGHPPDESLVLADFPDFVPQFFHRVPQFLDGTVNLV